jgi:adenylate cyclase, class 2
MKLGLQMVEVECKYLSPGPELNNKLAALGAEYVGEREEVDEYFNAPDRDFAQTDEALRIRRSGTQIRLTYKGPKRDAATKTRTELEVALAGPEAGPILAQILTSLGYRSVASVRKRRRLFHVALGELAAELCLDEVDEVGAYVELEIVATEDQVQSARDNVLRLAATLGLGQTERRSYLELLLSRRGLKE